MKRLFIFCLCLFLMACQQNGKVRKIEMYNTSGDMVGTASFSEIEGGVEIELELEGLTGQFLGIHVHENPICEGPDFTSAGNHLNPEGKKHGLMHPEGHHLGDLPNIEVDPDGRVEEELFLLDATLSEGKNSLLQNEGTSLIIKSKRDDGLTQPSGDSGERIICGELKAKDTEAKQDEPTDPTQFNEEKQEDEGVK